MSQGVLIFEGMKVGVLPGDMIVSFDPSKSKMILSTAYNVVPIWLRVAHDNALRAKEASRRIAVEWSEDAEGNRELLVAELEYCLQVFLACGIAFDAFYEQLKPFAKLTQSDIDGWRKNRTARAKQISEVIRRVFKLDKSTFIQFRDNLSEIVKYRDQAVHPSNELRRSCSRPDIPVGIDWKFALYRHENSDKCYRSTITMFIHLYENPCGNNDVTDSIERIFAALQQLGVVSLDKGNAANA